MGLLRRGEEGSDPTDRSVAYLRRTTPSAGVFTPEGSVYYQRGGPWKRRRAAWLGLGIESELGRDPTLIWRACNIKDPGFYSKKRKLERELGRKLSPNEAAEELERRGLKRDERHGGVYSGSSIFDPVLTELLYLENTKEGGLIFDPFAGGSVRGVVAGFLGRRYYGVELREEQVEANREQAGRMSFLRVVPTWIVGDSARLGDLVPPADFVFSCPPYGNLEKYSDDPADISGMSDEDFDRTYAKIVGLAAGRLKPGGRAAFVVANYRDRRGAFRPLDSITTRAFVDAGLVFVRERILVQNITSASVRVGKAWPVSRKALRVHQTVLIYRKA